MPRMSRDRFAKLLLAVLIAGFTVSAAPVRASGRRAETLYVADADLTYADGDVCAEADYRTDGSWRGGRGVGPYDSEEDAIQDAVDAAVDGAVVHICAGHYVFSSAVQVDVDILIEGDGAETTTLDGNDSTIIITSWVDMVGYPISVSDLTFEHGGNGAIYIDKVGSVRRCLFRDNSSSNTGGAITGYSTMTIVDSEFVDNRATWSGGAVLAVGGAIVRNSRFIRNTNVHPGDVRDDASGGAISTSGVALIESSYFEDNSAESAEGMPADSWGFGGAIGFLFGNLTVLNSTFVGNSAGHGGAIGTILEATVRLRGNTFTGNEATNSVGEGGAIRINGTMGKSTIRRNLFEENSAWRGGAMLLDDTESANDRSWRVLVRRNEFVENNATGSGGALFLQFDDSGNVYPSRIRSNRFADNDADVGGAIAAASNFGSDEEIFDRLYRALRANRFFGNSSSGPGGGSIVGIY